ncbi:hypothetical protein BBJ28_00006508 [Nothophytophthora sp. Chile5]|nr:hypothetical protein BBJ28_00006508 [Nothophytophthora sp. Chile5]
MCSGQETFDAKYKAFGLDTIWGWDDQSGILPCRVRKRRTEAMNLSDVVLRNEDLMWLLCAIQVYLRHCLLAVKKLGEDFKERSSTMQLVKQVKSFGGVIKQYSHESATTKCTMKFSIFLPPSASDSNKVPVLFYLAGLTCNDELLFVKAPEAQRVAASRGIAIVTTDTSPRGVSVPGDEDSWDFGTAAGFYVDATEPKWDEHYRMYSYVTKELPALITANFPVLEDKHSIMGHSMGGHGALVLGIRNPEYDATQLILRHGPIAQSILIDQGREDNFFHDKQLLPEAFEVRYIVLILGLTACQSVGQKLTLRMQYSYVYEYVQDGYDHSYYFIASFVEDHVNHHADALLQ